MEQTLHSLLSVFGLLDRKLTSFLNRCRFFPTKVRKHLHYLMYYSANPFFTLPALTDAAKTDFKALKENGIVKFHHCFEKEAAYINDVYGDVLAGAGGKAYIKSNSSDIFAVDAAFARADEFADQGLKTNVRISFRDPGLSDFYFNHDLTGLMCHYYGRQPYYRNNPYLYVIHPTQKSHQLRYGTFHVDNYHQLSIMFLLNDITEDDTHMIYVQGTHKKRVNYQYEYDQREIENKFSDVFFPLVGKAGTCFLFDAGGIHRAHINQHSVRKVMHLNITPGTHIEPTRHDLQSHWPRFQSEPQHIQTMFSKILCKSDNSSYF